MSTSTFTFLSNEKIAELIAAAQNRVIYAAPNLSKSVGNELWFWSALHDASSLRVIIDANAEAYRDGFGEIEGLTMLTDSRIEVRKAPGLRIGILVIDERAWVFSPTPEIIFDQPTESTFNAVEVSRDFAQQILVSIAPEFSVSTDPLESVVLPDSAESEIGTEIITQGEVTEIKKDLKKSPPQKFDATRQIRVYQNHFQFVDISLEKCNLKGHKIKIPSNILKIVSDEDVRKRMSASYDLLDASSETAQETEGLQFAVRELRELFTISVGEPYGRVIEHARKKEFLARVTSIQEAIEKVRNALADRLDEDVETNCRSLAKVLAPEIMKNPPPGLKYSLLVDPLDEKSVCDYLVKRIKPSTAAIDDLVSGMTLNVIFKDITFEMIKDEEFIKKIRKVYPDLPYLHSEIGAIEEKT